MQKKLKFLTQEIVCVGGGGVVVPREHLFTEIQKQ